MTRKRSFKFVLLAALICGCYFTAIGVPSLWDRDEPRFASSAVSMTQTGDYLVPHFNGELRPDKPVLVYWFMSAAIHVERVILPGRAELAPLEFTVRFFSALAAVVTCLLTYRIARKLIGPDAKWSMAILAGCPLMFFLGTAATADSVTLLFFMLCMAVLCDVCDKKQMGARHVILLGGAAGVTMLAKGPIGVIPFVIAAIWAIASRKEVKPFGIIVRLAGAFVIACLIFAAWAIPADMASGGELMKQFFGKHVSGRALESMESHGAGGLGSGWESFGRYAMMLPFYIPVVLIGVLPWTVFLFRGLKKLKTVELRKRRFLLSWILVVFVGFSLSATKLPHYMIWLIPACAIVCSIGIQDSRKTALGLVLAMPVVLIGLLIGIVMFESRKIAPQLVRQVRSELTADTPAAMYYFEEPSLVYYLNRNVEVLKNDQEVRAWLKANDNGIVFLRLDDLDRMRTGDRNFGNVIAQVKGFNYPKGRKRTVVAIRSAN
jgi:4-amino-4-deoxy-L-arabinose transferase-like glycosyltransferase